MIRVSKLTLQISAVLALGFAGQAGAQELLNETFTPPAPPCTQATAATFFPTGWTRFNVDNLTPNGAVGYVTNAWVVRDDFAPMEPGGPTDECAAFSTSWYTPAGTSNDFMCTPEVTIPALTRLNWRAGNYDPSYLDGYEVRAMRVTPTGGPGNIGNLLTNSTVLFSTPAEPADLWSERSVMLNEFGFANEAVHICFRNNSNDKFILLVDDVVITGIPDDVFEDGFEDPPVPRPAARTAEAFSADGSATRRNTDGQ